MELYHLPKYKLICYNYLMTTLKHEIITGFEDCNEVNEFREESQLRLVLLKKNFYNVDFR